MMPANRNILFVDDEQSLLDAIQRQLRRLFEVTVALGPEEGLRVIADHETFAVIVSDMRMPGKDGVQFLREVQKISPDSVRMMLTGNSDQKTAIDAVNQGCIFRFLQKPCETDALVMNLEAGIRQYELITAEKELLEKTLTGSIQLFMEILALSSPAAFSRAQRIKHCVSFISTRLQLENIWQFEVAAMLLQIGHITIPEDVMERAVAGEELSSAEAQMLSEHSVYTCKVLERIPRLENVAKMIELSGCVSPNPVPGDPVVIGAQMLRAALGFDALLSRGIPFEAAMKSVRESRLLYNSNVIQEFQRIPPPSMERTLQTIRICDLRADMVLDEDVLTVNNVLIVNKGQVASDLMRQRLANFVAQKTISDHVRVYVETPVFT
jgi:response regulator RpfG family c-di-GMP phosphodiesterase